MIRKKITCVKGVINYIHKIITCSKLTPNFNGFKCTQKLDRREWKTTQNLLETTWKQARNEIFKVHEME